MSAQLSLVYDPCTEGAKDWQDQLEALRAAVTYLGLKDVEHELDISKSMLSDALNERDRKRWAGEWTPVVKRMLAQRADVLARKLLRNIIEAELLGTEFELAQGDDEIADDELKAALAAIAAVRRRKRSAR